MIAHPVRRAFFAIVVACASIAAAEEPVAVDRALERAANYGFDGPVIYKIDDGIALPHLADVNGDGRTDVVIVNNRTASLELLLQDRPHDEEYRVPTEDDVNRLDLPGGLGRHSVPTEKKVTDLTTGDLDGDGHADIVYYGEPKELVILYGGSDDFDRSTRLRNRDGLPGTDVLAVADWTDDGRDDLLMLGEDCFFLYTQSRDGRLQGPERIPCALPTEAMEPTDFDGDGRTDLLLASTKEEPNLRLRYGTAGGGFGPELGFDFPMPRVLITGSRGADVPPVVLATRAASGRLQTLRLQTAAAAEFAFGNPTYFAGSDGGWSKPVAFAVADLTGDALPEIALARPTESAIAIYPGTADGPGAAVISPSYAGITHAVAIDLDGSGSSRLAVLSPEEKRVGLVRIDADGAASLPEAIPVDGEPVTMTAFATGDGPADRLAVVVKRDRDHILVEIGPQGATAETPLPPMKSDPERGVAADLDRDGVLDLALWAPYEGLVFLLRGEDGALELADAGEQATKASRSAFRAAPAADGTAAPALVWADRNYARQIALKQGETAWDIDILAQVNAPAAAARVGAAILADLDGDENPEAVLHDAQTRELVILTRDGNSLWNRAHAIALGTIAPEWIEAADLDGDGNIDLVLAGPRRIVLLRGGAAATEWTEVSSYRSPLDNPHLTAMDTGDLNGDGDLDVAICETANQHIEIVAIDRDDGLHPGTRFRAFEERRFRRARGENPYEPREIRVGDVTDDGLDDLVVVVHDRVIIYPQQSPRADQARGQTVNSHFLPVAGDRPRSVDPIRADRPRQTAFGDSLHESQPGGAIRALRR